MQQTGITNIGIVGGGELGQALGRAFRRQQITVQLYDKVDDRTTVATLSELVQANKVLLLCVPSWENRAVAREIAKIADGQERVVVSFSKGIEKDFVPMDEILQAALGENHVYGLAYGPMLAEELAVGRQAAGVLALSNGNWSEPLAALFLKARISLEHSTDVHGVALCGILKNVYAIAFGMNDGLHLGDNMKGKLAVMVLREMKQLLGDLQVDAGLAEGLAGLGDLITSGLGDASFNYRVGKTIAEGIADEKVQSEGLVTLKQLGEHLELKKYPILNTLDRLIYHYHDPNELQELLRQ